MLPDQVSNPGSLTYESGALPIATRPAFIYISKSSSQLLKFLHWAWKTIADSTKSIERCSKLLCRNVIVERL